MNRKKKKMKIKFGDVEEIQPDNHTTVKLEEHTRIYIYIYIL